MTEAEWNACADPTPMLEFLRGKASDRKLRLFAVACCRRIWPLLTDGRSRRAVEVAERHADDSAAAEEMMATGRAADDAWNAINIQEDVAQATEAAFYAAYAAAAAVWIRTETQGKWPLIVSNFSVAATGWAVDDAVPGIHPVRCSAERTEDTALANLLRDVLGLLPFRPVTLDPTLLAWNDCAVRKLAQTIYDDRAFNRLPLLADALEEAGCPDADILAHCRGSGEHVRGCWVVDLLLGKE